MRGEKLLINGRLGRWMVLWLLALLLYGCALTPDEPASTSEGGRNETPSAAIKTPSKRPSAAARGREVAAPQPRRYFVATDGSDSNDGRSLKSPFRSLKKAVSVVEPGETILLRAGVYEGATITHPGRSDAWITLRPYPGEQVVIDGSSRDEGVYFYNDEFAPMYWSVEGLELKGGNYYVVKIDTPQVQLLRNRLHGSKRDIIKLVHTADDVVIFGNEIFSPDAKLGANAQGVDIVGADRTWVAHNHVHDIPSIGMYAKGNARDTVFESNLVVNVHERGIMLGQSTDAERLRDGKFESYDGTIRNNVIINSGEACLASASSKNVNIYNNSCYNAAMRAHGAIFLSNESEVTQAGEHILIRNNIVHVSGLKERPAVKIGSNALVDPKTVEMDHNLFWSDSGKVTFYWSQQNLEKVSLKKWQQKTGFDLHSKVADPKFAETATLRLQAGSPALAAGEYLDELLTDYAGAARPEHANPDLGAHQRNATQPLQGAYAMPVKGVGEVLFRYPYLQAQSPNEVKILWATFVPGHSLLRLRRADATEWLDIPARQQHFAKQETSLDHDFEQQVAHLHNLKPNTEYVFDLLHNGLLLASSVPFKTIPDASSNKVSFAAFGDSGTKYSQPRKVRDAITTRDNGVWKYPHDFSMGVGDIAYFSGTYKEFNRNFFDQLSGKNDRQPDHSVLIRRPFFSSLGNHEYDNKEQSLPTGYLASFYYPSSTGMPHEDDERYYSFDSGPVHFVVLDSMKFVGGDDAAVRRSEMLAWLQADLKATTQPWKLVFFHHSPLSYGPHGTYGDRSENRRMRQKLFPMLQEQGVQMVIFGHDHMYQRTKPLKFDSDGQIIRKSGGVIDEERGITFIGVGNGGADLHNRSTQPSQYDDELWNKQQSDWGIGYDFIARRADGAPVLFDNADKGNDEPTTPQKRWGFAHVQIEGDQLTLRAYNYQHELMDELNLQRF